MNNNIIDFALISTLALFFFSSYITPGPNNFILMISSIKSGFKNSIPPCLGVILGNTLLVGSIAAIYILMNNYFEEIMIYVNYLKYIGAAYLLYLSYKLISSKEHKLANNQLPFKPSFIAMFFFQWVNPKAWAIAIGSVTLLAPEISYILPIIVLPITIFTQFTWIFAGALIREKIIGSIYEIYITRILGVTLALTVLMLLF